MIGPSYPCMSAHVRHRMILRCRSLARIVEPCDAIGYFERENPG